jgi:type III pantothenate kinase
MTPDVVADIGNSRLKWGRCQPGRIVEMVSLPLDDPQSWEEQRRRWRLPRPCHWAIASVNPPAAERFRRWLQGHGEAAYLFENPALLPLHVGVDQPREVGWDRLLNAVAAHCMAAPAPAVIIALGTAMTVDVVDGQGVFRGGAILPGPRLLADALHRHTALLPYLDVSELPAVVAPGTNTGDAMLAGIRAALVGGALLLLHHYADRYPSPWVFLTGGALGDLAQWNFGDRFRGTRHIPALTLEGLRIAAESLPDTPAPDTPLSSAASEKPPIPPS